MHSQALTSIANIYETLHQCCITDESTMVACYVEDAILPVTTTCLQLLHLEYMQFLIDTPEVCRCCYIAEGNIRYSVLAICIHTPRVLVASAAAQRVLTLRGPNPRFSMIICNAWALIKPFTAISVLLSIIDQRLWLFLMQLPGSL
eukprot:scaffold38504_cov17-Prasinocladus_malaysianus.AAC.1